MNLNEKKVLVVGTGKSGIAATRLLLEKGIQTVLFDGNKELNVEKLYEENPELNGVRVILGELSESEMKDFDLAVLSPGVPTDIPMVLQMKDNGIEIWGEIEFLLLWQRKNYSNNRNKWKDNNNCINRADNGKLFQQSKSCW